MPYLDDFCDDTLRFLRQNVVYVAVNADTTGVIEVVVEARDPPVAVSNIPVGVIGGVTAGGVYRIRRRTATDARALTIYFCAYADNKTKHLLLGNAALWVFTAQMSGCTFGVGSQGPGMNGVVRVAHANNRRVAAPGTVFGGATGRGAQRSMQALLATSYVGPGGLLIEPDTYMGADLNLQATTFGYHAHGGAWTFKALTYRFAGGAAVYGGMVDYPAP